MQRLVDELLRAEDHAAEATALPVNVLRCRVDDDIGTEFHGPLAERRCEHVVDDGQRATPLGDLGHGLDVDQLQHGIGRCLEEEGLRVRRHGSLPGRQIAPVDKGRCDAVARQEIFHDIEAAAEQRAARNDVVARLEVAQERGCHGGHAARRAAGGFRAFKRAHALLEHGDGRVRVAAIDIAVRLAFEAGFGLLGAVIDIARVEKKGFGGFAELAAQRPLMHQLRGGAPSLAALVLPGHDPILLERFSHDRRHKKTRIWLSPKAGVVEVRGPLATCFTWLQAGRPNHHTFD